MGYVLNESSTNDAKCCRKVASGRKVAGAVRSLVKSLHLECAKVLHEGLLMPVLLYGSETMIWREKERSRIRAVQMDNFRGLPYVRRTYRVPNAWIGVMQSSKMKAFSVGIAILKEWNDIIAKKVYVVECVCSCLVGRLQKWWIDSLNDCLK